MKKFSISDVETLTGIKAHTLRIWEQRYNFFKPKRTETNIRYYDDEDLRLFLNIANLYENGFKISRISKMTVTEISECVTRLKEDHSNALVQVQMLANATLRMDETEFKDILAGCITDLGLENTMRTVIFPLLQKAGLMWQVGTIGAVQEHFASHLICNRIIVETDKLSGIKPFEEARYLLFLPEGEHHEIGLLFAKYLLLLKGKQVLYLGPNVPGNSLTEVLPYFKPDYAVTVFTRIRTRQEIEQSIAKMLDSLPNVTLYLAGAQLEGKNITPHPRVIILKSLDEFEAGINSKKVSWDVKYDHVG